MKKKEMVQSFGDAFATAQVEGVFMGCGSRQKYRAKWTDLSEELIYEYGSNYRLFQDPSKKLPPKVPKIHGPQPMSPDAEGSSSAVSNIADAVKLYPSSAEGSEPECVNPQFPAISPLQICDNNWRTDPTLHLQAPRFGLMSSIHKPKLRFPQHFPAGIESSDLQCVEFFIHAS